MSPERAKVFVAEDDKSWQELIKEILVDEGHEVVSLATNLQDALAAIERLEELDVQVAIIDGNLTNYDTSGHDGQTVLKAIRETASKVKTIGLSGNNVHGVDKDLGKVNAVDLGKTVTDI